MNDQEKNADVTALLKEFEDDGLSSPPVEDDGMPALVDEAEQVVQNENPKEPEDDGSSPPPAADAEDEDKGMPALVHETEEGVQNASRTRNPHLGYKRATLHRFQPYSTGNALVTIEVLGENNENRADVVDPDFAKFRCAEARVLSVENFYSGDSAAEAISFRWGKGADGGLVYRTGETVRPDKYDPNSSVVCSNGIHYYRTKEAALRHHGGLAWLTKHTGTVWTYRDNGLLIEKTYYADGRETDLPGKSDDINNNNKMGIGRRLSGRSHE